jgi:hypothetical protein
MKWFPHDTDATQDAKIKKLLIKHGAVGYAIYFHCIELIAAEISETNLTFELEHDSEIIADNLHIKGTADKSGIDIVQEVMLTIIGLKLFEQSHGKIFCFKLLKRINTSITSNHKFREMILSAKSKNHDIVMINHDNVMTESCKTRLDKKDNTRLDKKEKKNNTLPFGEMKNVHLTQQEYDELAERITPLDALIDTMSLWLAQNNKVYKNYKAAILNWYQRDKKDKAPERVVPVCPACKKPMYAGFCRNMECEVNKDETLQPGL